MVEAEERRERPLGRTIAVPRAGQRAHAANEPAAQQSNDVDLVRALAEYHAATPGRDQLLRPPRAVHEIGVVLGVDHAQRPARAAGDDLARAQDGTIEAVAVADDHAHVRALRGIDHPAIVNVRGKGLWAGVELDAKRVKAKDVCLAMMRRGVLAKETQESVVRLAPPLVIEEADLLRALEIFRDALEEVGPVRAARYAL